MDETGYAIGFAYSAKIVVLKGNIINFKTIDGLSVMDKLIKEVS